MRAGSLRAMTIANGTAEITPQFDAREGRVVRLTIPVRAEYITLCRLALSGLARARPISEELLADLRFVHLLPA